jgi:hypothetical protein
VAAKQGSRENLSLAPVHDACLFPQIDIGVYKPRLNNERPKSLDPEPDIQACKRKVDNGHIKIIREQHDAMTGPNH